MSEGPRIFRGLTGPLIAAALIFVATLIISAPLSLVAAFIDFEKQDVAYSGVHGTIWGGGFSDLSVRGAPLGDVSFRLAPLSLLRASPSLSLTAKGGAINGEGRVAIGPGRKLTLENVAADIRLGAVAPRGVFGEPARGIARVDLERVVFSRAKGCQSAEGELWTDVLDAPAKRFNLPAMPMAGGVACEDGRLAVSLAGANAKADAEVVLRIDRTLAYEISARARPEEEGVASALRGFGFEEDNGALIYGSAGVFKGAGS